MCSVISFLLLYKEFNIELILFLCIIKVNILSYLVMILANNKQKKKKLYTYIYIYIYIILYFIEKIKKIIKKKYKKTPNPSIDLGS